MNAAEVKNLLSGRAEEVCAMLLPGGKRRGAEWMCGSLGGEAGESLKVHLVGSKAGVWADFAASQGGDIIDLWMGVKAQDFVAALRDIKQWLGIEDDLCREFSKPRNFERKFVRPSMDTVEPLQSGGPVFDYLTKTRKLDPEILHKYRVGQMRHSQFGDTIVFPAYEPTGRAVDMIKYLAVNRGEDGKKRSWSSAESKDHLIGWNVVTPNDRSVCITEGEIDAYTVAGWGTRALSIPRGVKAMDWIEHDYEALERFELIYISTDMDAEGCKCAEEIAARLGRSRCFRVKLPAPYKDANEAALAGFEGPDWLECVDTARTLDPQELRSIGEFTNEAWEALYPTNPKTRGTEPPIAMPWRCRHGEVSLWTGINGHGKSQLLLQFGLHDMWQDERLCIASLEMPAAKIAAQLVRMTLGRMPSDKERASSDTALAWLAERTWLIDRVGVIHWRELMPIMEYAAKRYGCTRYIIDSLVRVGIGEDDYEQQKEFVGALTTFAGKYGHVHLVAHPRKGQDEAQVPGKMDVRGSGTLADLVHNGFTVWRNKEKEAQMQQPVPSQQVRDRPDGIVALWKQRETGEEPLRQLWLHRDSGQFLSQSGEYPRTYLTNSLTP